MILFSDRPQNKTSQTYRQENEVLSKFQINKSYILVEDVKKEHAVKFNITYFEAKINKNNICSFFTI